MMERLQASVADEFEITGLRHDESIINAPALISSDVRV
jgi:hypothetical protein